MKLFKARQLWCVHPSLTIQLCIMLDADTAQQLSKNDGNPTTENAQNIHKSHKAHTTYTTWRACHTSTTVVAVGHAVLPTSVISHAASLEQLNELHINCLGRRCRKPRVLIKNGAQRPLLSSPQAAYRAACLGLAREAVHQYRPISTICESSENGTEGDVGRNWCITCVDSCPNHTTKCLCNTINIKLSNKQ